MSAVVLALLLLSPIPLVWLLSGSMRLARLRHQVHAAWWELDRTLRDRHDVLDSVRRVCRRNALDAALGLGALVDAQDAARQAIDGARLDAIVTAERQLDERVTALKGLLAYHSQSRQSDELDDLVACLDLMTKAIERAKAAYNTAVDNNNRVTDDKLTAVLASASGRCRAFPFRASDSGSDFQLIA